MHGKVDSASTRVAINTLTVRRHTMNKDQSYHKHSSGYQRSILVLVSCLQGSRTHPGYCMYYTGATPWSKKHPGASICFPATNHGDWPSKEHPGAHLMVMHARTAAVPTRGVQVSLALALCTARAPRPWPCMPAWPPYPPVGTVCTSSSNQPSYR